MKNAKATTVEKAATGPSPAMKQTITAEADEKRAAQCNKELGELMLKYNCVLTVPTLDISTGRIWPRIQVFPKPEAQRDV